MSTSDAVIADIAEPTSTERIRYGEPTYLAVVDFLIEEAWHLNHDLLTEWLDLLAKDFTYFMPVRQTKSRRDGTGFDPRTGHFYDDYASMRLRVKRVTESAYAYAEDPPSRARRFVTDVRVHRTEEPNLLVATSSVALFRNRWDNPNYDLVSVERRDVLRETPDGLRLVRRTILGDQATLGTPNLAIFL